MNPTAAQDVRVEESFAFVRRHVGESARLLDVGCGEGRLVERLCGAGFEACGIDASPEAVAAGRAAGRDVRERDFLSLRSDAFDALVFGASLHHLHPLADAVERAAALVVPGGLVLADEFDVVAPDVATARWFFDVQELLETIFPGEPDPTHVDPAWRDPTLDPLLRWEARHRHEPALATGRLMLDALGVRFEVVSAEPGPYLYWYGLDHLERAVRGYETGRRLLDLERRLIAAGRLRPVGLRVVARRRH